MLTFRDNYPENTNTADQNRKVSTIIALWLLRDFTKKAQKIVGTAAYMTVDIKVHCKLNMLLI